MGVRRADNTAYWRAIRTNDQEEDPRGQARRDRRHGYGRHARQMGKVERTRAQRSGTRCSRRVATLRLLAHGIEELMKDLVGVLEKEEAWEVEIRAQLE